MLHRSFIDGIKTYRVQGFKQSKTQNSARLITRKTNRNRTYVAIVIASNDDRAEENAQKKKTSKNGEDSNAYSKTVILPQAKFEMRANSVLKEPLMQKWWEISFLCFYRRTRESERGVLLFFLRRARAFEWFEGIGRSAVTGERAFVRCELEIDWLILIALARLFSALAVESSENGKCGRVFCVFWGVCRARACVRRSRMKQN